MVDRTLIEFRSRMLQRIRFFFAERHYLEVETPRLAPAVIPESHLNYFRARGSGEPLTLLPSPEYWLKQLLAEGSGSLFEIARCFRSGEPDSPHHNPEFTMLEWYTVDADSPDNIGTTRELLNRLVSPAREEGFPVSPAMENPAEEISMAEACRRWGDFELRPDSSEDELLAILNRKGLPNGRYSEGEESWESLFNRLFLTLVEPELPSDRPVFLTQYPRQIRTTARTDSEGWADRWELYAGGVELANCYGEERNKTVLKDFFHQESAARQDDPHFPPADAALPEIMSRMPRCSGVAMGVDRLMSLLTAKSFREGVILFPFPDILSTIQNKSKDRMDL